MALTRLWFLGVGAVLVSGCGSSFNPGINAVNGDEQTAIINGHPSTTREYPATGALLLRGTDAHHEPMGAICTGTLIAPDVVLTAAHCNDQAPGERLRYYFSFARDVTDAGDTAGSMPDFTVGVRQIVQHPDYGISDQGGLGRSNDVALVFLKRPVLNVVPALMLSPSEAAVIRVNAAVDIVGYGLRRAPPATPDEADETAPSDEGEAGIKSSARSVISEVGAYELQIGHGLPEPEKCYGDSGGPTYLRTAQGPRVIGVTSHTYDDTQFAHGTVDERIDAVYGWAQDLMQTACADGRRSGC